MNINDFSKKITDTLNKVCTTQEEKIHTAAGNVADTIKNDGIIYIFGCGHSHLVGLDCFYRAGGLANVSAMLDTDLMLHNGAAKSSKLEKMPGIAEEVFRRYCITDKDILFVVSTSGKNAVPVEMAKVAKEKGVRTVAVVSSEYFCHKGEMPLLAECADMYIDNCVPYGDAVMEIENVEEKMGSISTAVSSFVLQSILMEAAELAAKDDAKIPVYLSGNIPGGAEHNKALIDRFMPRVKHL